jgi:hypothetical protein
MQIQVPFIRVAITFRFERRPRRSFRSTFTLQRMMLLVALLSLPMWYAAELYWAAVAQQQQTAKIERMLAARRLMAPRGTAPLKQPQPWLFRLLPWTAN